MPENLISIIKITVICLLKLIFLIKLTALARKKHDIDMEGYI